MNRSTKKEQVNHPAHYNTGKIEVIDAIEDWKLGFNDGNCVKYIARAPHKENELQDLLKAEWYLKRKIQSLLPESKSENKLYTDAGGTHLILPVSFSEMKIQVIEYKGKKPKKVKWAVKQIT